MWLCLKHPGDSQFFRKVVSHGLGFRLLWKRRKELSVGSGMTWSLHTHMGKGLRAQDSKSPQGTPNSDGPGPGSSWYWRPQLTGSDAQKLGFRSSREFHASEVSVAKRLEQVLSVFLGV